MTDPDVLRIVRKVEYNAWLNVFKHVWIVRLIDFGAFWQYKRKSSYNLFSFWLIKWKFCIESSNAKKNSSARIINSAFSYKIIKQLN
jgi:hypothetical protein